MELMNNTKKENNRFSLNNDILFETKWTWSDSAELAQNNVLNASSLVSSLSQSTNVATSFF